MVRKYSDFLVTLNTHRQPSGPLLEHCYRVIREQFDGNLDAAAEIFDEEPQQIQRSTVSELYHERSKRQSLLHFHFVWEVQHSTRLRIGASQYADHRGLNPRMQDYFSEALGINGVYVHCTLLRDRSRSKNYASKGLQDALFSETESATDSKSNDDDDEEREEESREASSNFIEDRDIVFREPLPTQQRYYY
jgi:hypothetical protein